MISVSVGTAGLKSNQEIKGFFFKSFGPKTKATSLTWGSKSNKINQDVTLDAYFCVVKVWISLSIWYFVLRHVCSVELQGKLIVNV